MLDEYILTENEKALLDYAYTDKDRIRDGVLFDYQIDALKMIRKCDEYLKKKYPKYDLEMITFNPQTKKRCYTEIHFILKGIEAHFVLHYEIKDGKDYFSDNFYDVPFIKEYDKKIELLLKNKSIEARCFTIFPYLLSETINSADELLNEKRSLGRNTEIFINVSELPTDLEIDRLSKIIEDLFNENKIYMNGMIYFIQDLDMSKENIYYDSYVKDRKNQKNMVLSAFRTRC